MPLAWAEERSGTTVRPLAEAWFVTKLLLEHSRKVPQARQAEPPWEAAWVAMELPQEEASSVHPPVARTVSPGSDAPPALPVAAPLHKKQVSLKALRPVQLAASQVARRQVQRGEDFRLPP